MSREDVFGWLDVDFIGELLCEHHPDRDPVRIGFVELKKLVASLPGFREEPGHGVNEKILEHIQATWIQERAGGRKNDED
ncbi:MAG: Fe-S cluster assembly protein IscX [Phycisphaerales bacterium]